MVAIVVIIVVVVVSVVVFFIFQICCVLPVPIHAPVSALFESICLAPQPALISKLGPLAPRAWQVPVALGQYVMIGCDQQAAGEPGEHREEHQEGQPVQPSVLLERFSGVAPAPPPIASHTKDVQVSES